MTSELSERLLEDFQAVLKQAPTGPLGVAVSGGSDSVALLCLLTQWARDNHRQLKVVTVDHGLRPESADEALNVARLCTGLTFDHTILRWQDWDGRGNLQDQARMARKTLISAWAAENNIKAVALGHTQNDQAETFLMRLARGSGVDGLAAMAPVSYSNDLTWLRPALQSSRDDLRAYLRNAGVTWTDDPSNENQQFDRIKIRKLMPVLAEIGLTADRLSATATRMREGRDVLNDAAHDLAQTSAKVSELGYIEFQAAPLAIAQSDTRLRLLAHALNWVSGARYRPRLNALTSLSDAISDGTFSTASTLHGCIIRSKGSHFTICREVSACGPAVASTAIWDARWQTTGPPEMKVCALSAAGLLDIPDWRDTGHPRDALISSPAFWKEAALFAAPFATNCKQCRVQLLSSPAVFFSSLASR